MKRAVPVLLLSAAGLVPVWMFQPHPEGEINEAAAAPEAPQTSTTAPSTPGQTSAPQTQTQQTQQQNANRVIKGKLVQTSEGNVQVQVTFQGTKIVDIAAITAPNTAPTRKALPLLKQSALQAQSAQIDTVSGATATSGGYQQSLQSAIDQAK
jgi:uncharacterized protein with FMN-binding domain